jgi:hypothetical protein
VIAQSLRDHKVALTGLDITGLPEARNIKDTAYTQDVYVNRGLDTPCGARKAYKNSTKQLKKPNVTDPTRPPNAPRKPSGFLKEPENPEKKLKEEHQTKLDKYKEYELAKMKWDKWLQTPTGQEYLKAEQSIPDLSKPMITPPMDEPDEVPDPGPYSEYIEEKMKEYRRQLKNYVDYKNKKEKYEEWERSEEGKKYIQDMKDWKAIWRKYNEERKKIKEPSCVGDCPKCTEVLMANLSKEIEELYKKFGEWIQ